jgi:hypothetical protein
MRFVLFRVPEAAHGAPGVIYTAAIMDIRRISRNRVYFVLGLVYAISVAVICFRAPVVQRDIFDQVGGASGNIDLSAGMVPDQSQTATSQTVPVHPLQLNSDDVEVASNQHQTIHTRAPLWALGSIFTLDLPLFATELGELLGLVLIVALAYRFRMRLVAWGAEISAFIASRRRGTCIWLGFAVVLVLTLFPPWAQINTYGGRYPTQRVKLWHARIDRAPVETTRWQTPEVDYDRMLTEIAVGECFVLALYLTWARSIRKQ